MKITPLKIPSQVKKMSCTFSQTLFFHPQHVAVICKFVAAWFVPSAPMQVKNDRLFDKLNRLKEELRCVTNNMQSDR